MGHALCDQLFVDALAEGEFQHYPSVDADDLFSILETWEDFVNGGAASAALSPTTAGAGGGGLKRRAVDGARQEKCDGGERDDGTEKRQKCSDEEGAAVPKTAHITVERNRRKQMNEHLAVLRSLMPCFYVKRGDQASIIGGVVDYIKELQQVLQTLQAKKQRKAYVTEQVILSPRPPPVASSCSPRLPLSPRPPLLKPAPPLSPRLSIPISPRTPPTPGSPYYMLQRPPPMSGSTYVSPAMTPTSHDTASYLPSLDVIAAELSAYASRQAAPLVPHAEVLPDVRVEFAGANLVLRTVSHRARPGQAVKIIAALESRSLEILHAKISTVDDTAVNSFTVKIGIECELSAEELVQEIQQTLS